MPHRALVYGDVDLNLIDGSAIWAQSMVQALAAAGCEVTLVLKAPVRTGRLVDPLAVLPGVTIRRPHEEALLEGLGERGMSVRQAARVLLRVDAERPHDLIVVRGQRLAARLAAEPAFAGRLWTYLTDIPQSVAALDPPAQRELTRIAKASRFLLCQTEELRDFLEATVPAACGRCVLTPPVVADPGFPTPARDSCGEPLRLVYTGKFALRWNTYEMTGLPRLLACRGVAAELHMVGDKIHDERDDPAFARRMRTALETTPQLVWHGGVPRQEAMKIAASCDVGLSWRHPDLDASLELSTKVLEFGALGLPVVLNRTPMHEDLLGIDYPLFAATEDEVVDVLALAARDAQVYARAARRCQAAASRFTLEQAVARLTGILERAFPRAAALQGRPRPLRVAVAGHDLKFFTRLLDYFRSLPGLELRLDRWRALSVHDEAASRETVEWADVVVCEWCGPNAVWYSRHVRPDQRLLVRLHRFELYADWPRQVDVSRVDRVICVSPHYATLTRERTGWPADKVVAVPNWVDVTQFDRPKLEDARFHLGMIGIAPARKRLDLGLDVLAELRRRDRRFMLYVKSKLPWDYWWIWKREEERAYFETTFRRIQRDPDLVGAVVFDPYGPDVAAWLRRVGFVLSTSDDESFHLAPAEGMASGAVPVIRDWPGVDTIYDTRWIHRDPAAMASAIHRMVTAGTWDDERRLGQAQVREAYDLDKVCARWNDLLTGGAASA